MIKETYFYDYLKIFNDRLNQDWLCLRCDIYKYVENRFIRKFE